MRVKVTLRCNECKQRNYNTMAEEAKKKKDRGLWFREMKSELKKVVWPNKQTVAKNTGTVLLCSLLVGACIWIFDFVATSAVQMILNVFGA